MGNIALLVSIVALILGVILMSREGEERKEDTYIIEIKRKED